MAETQLIDLIVGSAIIVAVSLLVFEGLGRLVGRVARRAGARTSTVRTIHEVARVLGAGIAAFGVVTYTGLASIFTILTISGVLGLVVSLALQTTLSNIISGVLLLRDQLVSHGDVITFSGVKGRVIRVALRNTWILTESGQVAVIGNSNLANGPLINHTASPQLARRYQET